MPVTKARLQKRIDFPRQQLLRERATILRYTYIASLCIIVVHAKRENTRSKGYIRAIVFIQ